MVWIPGGAFLNGAGQLQLYNGSRLAANGNVVVVNVTYRVGVFGGFELGDLGDGFENNLCLRDQIAALAWVRDNIAAFGGDSDRVTVFGESAGATSVLALLCQSGRRRVVRPGDCTEPCVAADRRPRDASRAGAAVPQPRSGVTAEEPKALKELPQRELLAGPRGSYSWRVWRRRRRWHTRADLRGRSAAATPDRGSAGGRDGSDPVDHRHQPTRGVAVRRGQAVDGWPTTPANIDLLLRSAGSRGPGAGAGGLPRLPTPPRAGGHRC